MMDGCYGVLSFEGLRAATARSKIFSAARSAHVASPRVPCKASRQRHVACAAAEKNKASVCKDTRNTAGLSRRVRFRRRLRPCKHAQQQRSPQQSPGPRAPICVHAAALQRPDQLLAFTERRAPQRRARGTSTMFAPQGPEPIVAIKAGKCKVEPHRDEAKRAAG